MEEVKAGLAVLRCGLGHHHCVTSPVIGYRDRPISGALRSKSAAEYPVLEPQRERLPYQVLEALHRASFREAEHAVFARRDLCLGGKGYPVNSQVSVEFPEVKRMLIHCRFNFCTVFAHPGDCG